MESYPDRFQVATLAAGSNVEAAFEQAAALEATRSVAGERARRATRRELSCVPRAWARSKSSTAPPARFGWPLIPKSISWSAPSSESSGLEATYEAVRAGKTVGLANKECLVVAGELIVAEARRQGKPLLPIDSEHNAVHQCLRGGRMDEVERIWLTASGGPFLKTPKSEFAFHYGPAGA